MTERHNQKMKLDTLLSEGVTKDEFESIIEGLMTDETREALGPEAKDILVQSVLYLTPFARGADFGKHAIREVILSGIDPNDEMVDAVTSFMIEIGAITLTRPAKQNDQPRYTVVSERLHDIISAVLNQYEDKE